MPKVEIEIMRTVTITREESATVELDVPKQVLADEEVLSWVDEIMDKDDDGTLSAKDKALYLAINSAEWEASDEDESVEYNDAYAVD